MEHTHNLVHLEPNSWFALFIKSQKERSTSRLLQQKGYETFLPLYRQRRTWVRGQSGREKPVFPGYLFCRFNPRWRMPVLTTPGVLTVVGCAGRPVPIDDTELLAIRMIAASLLSFNPCPYLDAGKRVRILEGPLAGLKGILLEPKRGRHLVVSVSLMQRSVAVELDNCAVEVVAAEPIALQTALA